ncbi:hypothetical protein [Fusobacterium sp. SYSU M8D902]|uniref:hypothetical protein n=1 Tax=Fusobacterium sp. SYSU M8D902 TaxID=3159562 RepID=UPI0032E3CBB9
MEKNKRNELILSALNNIMNKTNYQNNGELEDIIFFIGAFSLLIDNKLIFKKNKDLAEFLEKKFEVKFAEYCKKSRPLMIGKTIKHFIEEKTDPAENINELYRTLILFKEGKLNETTWSDIIKNINLESDL